MSPRTKPRLVLQPGEYLNTHVRYWPTPRGFAALKRDAPEHPLYRNPDGTLREWGKP